MKKIVLGAAVAAMMSSGVQAESLINKNASSNFNYNYVDVTYVDIDEPSLDGFRFKGSYDIAPNLSLIGSLALADDNGVDLTQITMGGAYHMAIKGTEANKLDVVLHGEFERIKYDWKGGDDSDSGLLLGAEARLGVTNEFEAFGDLSLRTTGDNDTLLTVGGRFSFSPQLQGIASYEISDFDVLSLGVRYNF